MKTLRSRVTTFIGLLALIAGSVNIPAQAQDRRVEKKPPDNGSGIEAPVPVIAAPDLRPEAELAPTIKFLEAKFAFDKLVKGAPYSAVAVTETTQTLSDGNQITRKTEVTLYRDSEGRTRREQTLEGVKNWQAAGDRPRMVFINDPIAGHNYVLDPQSRTARKTGGKGKPGEPIYNEKEKMIEKLEAASQKMARKPGATEPGDDTTDKPSKATKKPWSIALQKGVLFNTVTGISADKNIQEAIENIDEVLMGMAPPNYDEAAKTAGVQGSVTMRLVLDEAGRVESMTVEQGTQPFLESVVAGLKQIRFRPLLRDGKAVRNEGTITFRFTVPPAQGTAAGEARIARPPKQPSPAEGPSIARPAKQPTLAEGPSIPRPPKQPTPAEGPSSPRPVKSEISIGAKKTESLGKQMIEGIEAEGTRSTATIAAGEIGNRLPIEIVDERWYSPELQTLLISKHHDPRSGETIYRLTNINRSEPDRSLFEVPSDYYTLDVVKPGGPARIKKPEDEL